MFNIRKIDNNIFPIVVIATSYNNPLSCLNSIAEHLHDKEFSGKVLFDLLCSNGLESNRFMSAVFDGVKFSKNTFKVESLDTFPSEIVENQNAYFSNHKWLLENSILSNHQVINFH